MTADEIRARWARFDPFTSETAQQDITYLLKENERLRTAFRVMLAISGSVAPAGPREPLEKAIVDIYQLAFDTLTAPDAPQPDDAIAAKKE